VSDGLSNTIFIAERYASCGPGNEGSGNNAWSVGQGGIINFANHIWNEDGQNIGPVGEFFDPKGWISGSFWVPLTPTSLGSDTNGNPIWQSLLNYPWSYAVPYQPTPPIKLCNPRLLQSFSVAGIQVGLGDGSVRIIPSGISNVTWGRAIDPQDGFPLGSDW
jgi:hypothetical protein